MTDWIDNDDLILLIEECSEVIQAATKIIRFGAENYYQDGKRNDEELVQEIGDVFAVVERMNVPQNTLAAAIDRKRAKLKIYAKEKRHD